MLRAFVARANTFATLRLLALAPFTLFVIGVVDQIVAVGTFVGVAVDLSKVSDANGQRQKDG